MFNYRYDNYADAHFIVHPQMTAFLLFFYRLLSLLLSYLSFYNRNIFWQKYYRRALTTRRNVKAKDTIQAVDEM